MDNKIDFEDIKEKLRKDLPSAEQARKSLIEASKIMNGQASEPTEVETVEVSAPVSIKSAQKKIRDALQELYEDTGLIPDYIDFDMFYKKFNGDVIHDAYVTDVKITVRA